jgi:endogenous inhibitor of DNA gyrase (YacG/DUF329 family)
MRVICPTCRQSTTWEENRHRPFCSERCRKIDLGRWASDEYRIPAEEAPASGVPSATGPDPDAPPPGEGGNGAN